MSSRTRQSIEINYGDIWLCCVLLTTDKQSHDYGSISGQGIGVGPGLETEAQKVWNIFIALGNIAFAYSYSAILIEIQVCVAASPALIK